MITMLAALLAVQAQVQIAEPDVPVIVETVLGGLVPVDGEAGGRPTEGRPLFIDIGRTALAFRQIAPDVDVALAGLQRPHFPRDRDTAITCVHDSAGRRAGPCEVTDDGIFFSVLSVARAANEREYRLTVALYWNDINARGAPRLAGYDMEISVALVEDQWRVLPGAKASVH